MKNDMNNLDGGPLFAMRKVYAFRSITGLVALTALVTGAPTVAAQGALEEVVVTARKRVDSLQDVPIAITTIG